MDQCVTVADLEWFQGLVLVLVLCYGQYNLQINKKLIVNY